MFFALILAYIVPTFDFITCRTVEAYDDLRPVLDIHDDHWAEKRHGIDHKPRRWILITSLLGLILGFMHAWLIQGSPLDLFISITENRVNLIMNLATLMVWTVMTTVITALADNALLFANLGRDYVRIDLLNTKALTPFARVAVISTLVLIGAQAAFPLMFIEGEFNVLTVLPGFLAITIPMVIILVMPLWPIHRRIQTAKKQEFSAIQLEINQQAAGNQDLISDQPALQTMNSLLAYRREIMQVSEWPFDIGAITRLGLYLIIPPLTWVGAALIENMVDMFL